MRLPWSGRSAQLYPFEVSRPLSSAEASGETPRLSGGSTPRIKIPRFTGFLALEALQLWNQQYGQGYPQAEAVPAWSGANDEDEQRYRGEIKLNTFPRMVILHANEVYAASNANPARRERILSRMHRKLEPRVKEQNEVFHVMPAAMTQVGLWTGEYGRQRLALHFHDPYDPVLGELAYQRQVLLETLADEGFTPSEVRNPGFLLGELSPDLVATGLAHHVVKHVQDHLDNGLRQLGQLGTIPLENFRIMGATLRQEYVETPR